MDQLLKCLCILDSKPSCTPPRLQASCKLCVHAKAAFTFETQLFYTDFQRHQDFFKIHLTPYGKYYGTLIEDFDDYSGINKKLITANGHCLPKSWLHEDGQIHGVKDGAYSLNCNPEAPCESDNCVGLLYNLLRIYFATTMKHIEYDPTERFYQGHNVHVTNEQYFGTDIYPVCKWILSVKIKAAQYGATHEDCGEVWLNWRDILSKKSARILSAAASLWSKTSPLGVLHPSPALCENIIRLVGARRVRTHALELTAPLYLSEVSLEDVLKVISTLVMANRLEGQFDIALAMLMQIFVNHKPCSIEGLIWCHATKEVRIPRLRSFRGWNSAIVTGQAHDLDADKKLAFHNWCTKPLQIFWPAVVLSEVTHYQMHLIANHYKPCPPLIFFGERSCGEADGRSLTMDLLLASSHSGIAILKIPRTYAGLVRFSQCRDNSPSKKILITVESAVGFAMHPSIAIYPCALEHILYPFRSTISLTEYVPFVLQALSPASSLHKDLPHQDSMTARLRVKSSGTLYTHSRHEFIKFMTITRLMGLDVIGVQHNPWRKILNNTVNDMGCLTYYPPVNATVAYYTAKITSNQGSRMVLGLMRFFDSHVAVTAKITDKVVLLDVLAFN